MEAGKGYVTKDFAAESVLRALLPMWCVWRQRKMAQKRHEIWPRRSSSNDGSTLRHRGYAQSINARKQIEQVFGWIKQAAGMRWLKSRGRSRVGAVFRLHVVAYNLIRLANLRSPQEVVA